MVTATAVRTMRLAISLLLAIALCLPGGRACNLSQKIYATSGRIHRCLNSTGTNEWHLNNACWLRPLGDPNGSIVELEIEKQFHHADGRVVAECRRRYVTALVYHLCVNASVVGSNSTQLKWPGDVWSGDDGLQYTCTNASRARGSNFDRGSQVVLYGCNSTFSGRMFAPGSKELQGERGGVVRRCTFSGMEISDPQYRMEALGCWIQNRSDPARIVRLKFNDKYTVPSTNNNESGLLATCVHRYSGDAIVYHKCIEYTNSSSEELLHQPGKIWSTGGAAQLECLPADTSELTSAHIIQRACKVNSTLFTAGSNIRNSDGSIEQCVFNRYKSAYGWYSTVGCWLKEAFWSNVVANAASVELLAGDKFCPKNVCLAKCDKKRYRESVALLALVCFENVGRGSIYRLPGDNWTDDDGLNRTCISAADQSYKFGIGAETIFRGCRDKVNNSTLPHGSLYFGDDFITYVCAYNEYTRAYSFDERIGCWMHDSEGQRVRIDSDGAFKVSSGQTIATCRKKRYSTRVALTIEICFKSSDASPLQWDNASIAIPGDFMTNGSSKFQCNPAATYSDGVHAKWILYGCLRTSGVEPPGSSQLSENGAVKECAHNEKDGNSAAYSWVKPIGCWFQDHRNETIVISSFDTVFKHPAVGRKTAVCVSNRYSDPKLSMFVCFSVANRRFYVEGDEWTDTETGLAQQCIAASSYSRDGVKVIHAGCWLQTQRTGGNSSAMPEYLLSANGTVAYGSDNRVIRCDFNEYRRKFQWSTSVACWHTFDGSRAILPIGQEFLSNGLLIYKCLDTRKGAAFVQHSCEHNGTWHASMSTWRDSYFWYECLPAWGDRHAEIQKTHCITDDGTPIDDSQVVSGVQYVCMRICGFLVFLRDPSPQQYQFLFSFINNCHAVNMNIINGIG